MNFNDLIIMKDKIPENLEEVFLSNLKKTLPTIDNDPEFLSFIDGFINKHGHTIYEFHLKTFTKKELWKNILLSDTEEYKKMIQYMVKFNTFLMPLMEKYIGEEKLWRRKTVLK